MQQYLSAIVDLPVHGDDVLVSGLTLDSRAVRKGELFVALKGALSDGHAYINDAIANGASAVMMERECANDLTVSYVVDDNLKKHLGDVAAKFYQTPSAFMNVIGVTGTNGKSSVCSYIQQLFTLLKASAAEIGTLGIRYPLANGDIVNQPSINTTPDAITLQCSFDAMKAEKVAHVAMEVSSHALQQGRCVGTQFDVAVFTNLSHDHLDYHGNMENYAAAKLSLFEQEGLRLAVINADDELAQRVVSASSGMCRSICYSVKSCNADVYFSDIQLSACGVQAELHYQGRSFSCEFPLVGSFNCSNVLAAIIAVCESGFDIQSVVQCLPHLTQVAGRMQLVENVQGLTAIVDYAHTPDALGTVLQALRELSKQRIILVFGCGGDRDIDKRPMMAAIAERFADVCIVTADNPRGEAIVDINAAILAGFTKNSAIEIDDRQTAIEKAVAMADAGDVILVAGKGHETYQQFADKTIDFDDVAMLRLALDQKAVLHD